MYFKSNVQLSPDSPRSIRVLDLLPDTRKAAIRAKLRVVLLDAYPRPYYEALSYTRRPDNPTASITINEIHELEITANAFAVAPLGVEMGDMLVQAPDEESFLVLQEKCMDPANGDTVPWQFVGRALIFSMHTPQSWERHDLHDKISLDEAPTFEIPCLVPNIALPVVGPDL